MVFINSIKQSWCKFYNLIKYSSIQSVQNLWENELWQKSIGITSFWMMDLITERKGRKMGQRLETNFTQTPVKQVNFLNMLRPCPSNSRDSQNIFSSSLFRFFILPQLKLIAITQNWKWSWDKQLNYLHLIHLKKHYQYIFMLLYSFYLYCWTIS